MTQPVGHASPQRKQGRTEALVRNPLLALRASVARSALAAFAFLATTSAALAQKPPELGYVFPPVVQAGATTDVQLGGYDFTPDMQFFTHDKRAQLTVTGPPGEFFVPPPPYWFGSKGRATAFPIPREVPAKITVPRNFPAGPVRWQVANANGSSATAVFLVSDRPTLLEQRDRDKPQQLKSLPVGVSGRLRKIAEVDRYRFTATKNGPVTVELFARRLGANFNGIVKVRDASGKVLADVADTEGLDTATTFAAKSGRTYEVALYDVDYRGNRAFVYHLEFTPGPRVVTTIPAAGMRGKTIDVEFVGYGVATGRAKLESVRRKIAFPQDPRRKALRYRLKTPFGLSSPIDIPLGDLNESVALTAVQSKPLPLSIPGAVTGRLGPSGRATYSFTAKKGDVWSIAAQSRAINTGLDLSLSIRDATGKQVAANDDAAGTLDAGLTWRVGKAARYTCVIDDLSSRAGTPDAVYRLAISRPEPSFSLSVSQKLNLSLTGKSSLTVKAVRSGGFQGQITVTIEGLPPDMKVPGGLTIPAKKNSLKIVIERTANAPSHAALIRVFGKAAVNGKTVVQTANAPAAGNLCPRRSGENRTSGVLLATTMKPPFSVELIGKNRQRAVHRGTTYPAEFLIKRDAGFTGDVLLQMAARQSRHRQGIRGPIVKVPGNVSRVRYPCFLPEWLETDRTTRMTVLSVAGVKDLRGKLRYLTKPANARITMILEGALLKVAHQASELTVAPGGSFTIPVEIARSAKLVAPVTIRLLVPTELEGLVKCEPVTLAPDRKRAELKVTTSADAKLSGRRRFVLKATALRNTKWAVVSQTTVPVEFGIDGNENSPR